MNRNNRIKAIFSQLLLLLQLSIMIKKVVIAGESPFVEEVTNLCEATGYDVLTYLVEDFLDAMHSGYLLGNITDADVVLELHHESQRTKQELLTILGDIVPYKALVMTSALSISTTEAARWVPRPERVVGFGVLPPLGNTGHVELARGILTSDEAVTASQEFWQSLGYESALVGDGAGLVRARVVCCLINEAVTALQENVASPADIDQAMKLGTNYPHGPLAWADHLGLDTVYGVMMGLYAEWKEDRYRPAPLLKRMVVANRLGKKTGHGFYEYQT